MIEQFFFLIVLFLAINGIIVKGLEVVYYQDFTPSLSCSNLFSQYWSIVSGSFSGGSCQYQCQRSDNGNQADILSPDMSSYPNGLQMIKSITQPYSFFGVDLVYLRKIDSLNMNIFDGDTSLFNQNYSGASTGTNIEYNYSLTCSQYSGYMQVSKETVQLNQSLTSNNIKVQFIQHVTNGYSWYGVLKLRTWANCVENCDICLNSTNCSSCLQGFDRYTLQSGQKVCEQTQDCNINNCFSCIKSSPSSLTVTCVKCLPGYSLDANNNCFANPGGACPANQYQSKVSVCQTYSTQCYMQKQNTYYTWQICPGQVNLSQYKCLYSQSILIYEHKNYSLYTCGCPVNNCIQCPNPNQCSQCQLGYTYDPISQTCIFVMCPVLYSRDPQTGLCNKNCSGNDCQQCDQNQQCILCNPTGNYYIETTNPANCALCTIQNCLSCSGEGLCYQCQNHFSLSQDRTACNPCNVNNCNQCVIGQPSLCQTCIAGYIQSFDQTTCSCSVQNCQACNSQDGTICDFCVNGYLISLEKKQCSCAVPNCSQCNLLDGTQCQTCVSGYNLNPLNSKCLCNVPNCQTCNSLNGNLCDSCVTNYAPVGIQSPTCTCQVYGCQTCTPLNGLICQICYSNFIISQSGSCLCNVQNCSQCSATDGNLCNTCLNNYQLSSSKTSCDCQVNSCNQCDPNNGKICIFPKPGYTYDSISQTNKCNFANCQICDPNNGNICLQCQSGYNFNSNQCQCNVSNCLTCNSSNGNLCDSCITNYAPVGTQSPTCTCQVYGCQTCTPLNGLICQICYSNFIISQSGSCLCNVQNCSQCSATDGNLCNTCLNNYQLSSSKTSCDCQVNSCNQCDPNNGKICIFPKPGYTYDSISQTNKCNFANCQICDPNNGNICLQCQSGYNFNSNQCQCNVSNCLTCNSSNGNLCDSCITNYAPVGTQSPTCTCQVYGCQTCTPLNGLICQICYSNFIISQSGSCLCNVQNCSQCNATDGNICNTCMNNYLLNNSKTSCDCQVNSCNQCDPNNGKICISPKAGYTYDPLSQTNKCNFENCKRCDPNDGNICLQCQNGYNFSSNQCQCNVQYCQKCDPLNGSTCQQCITEYHFNPTGQTVQCQLNCSLDNCKECQDPPNNKTQCKSCNSGYVLDPSTNQCVSTQCKVPQCSQCQPYKPNRCQTCNDKYNLDSDSQCILSIRNDFSVQQTVIQNVGYNVTLIFKNQIVMEDQNFDSQLKIQIQDYVNPFQVTILYVQEQSIKIQLKLQDNCKNKNLVVQMKDPSFVQINNLVDPQKEVKLNEYVVLSESQIQQSQQTKQVTSGASSSLLIMMILMIVIGNTYVLFSTIDLTTFIYFMLFIDVRYPDNVMSFCSIFQNFQFAFIPNSIQVYFMDPNYTQPYTPKKFIDNGYDAYFFNGAGQSLTIIAGIMMIYGIIKVLSYVPVTSLRVYIKSKIKSGWEFCGFFDMVGCVYVYLLISSLLQFYSFQFDESLAFINYTLFSITFVFTIIYPIMITIFIKKCKNLNDPQIQMQFGSIIGGLVIPQNDQNSEEQNKKQENNLNQSNLKMSNESKSLQKIENEKLTRQKQLQYKWSRYTNVILYARKIIYMMVLLYFYGQVYFQMIIINSMNIFLSIYYLYLKPQEEKSANIKNGISEVLLVIMQVTICFLVKDDESQREEDRFNIGWIIVGSASLILTIHIFSVIVDLLKGIYNLVKDFICTLIKPKAEIEKLKQEKLAQEQNKQNKFLRLASQISIDKLTSMKKKLSLIAQSQLDISMVSIQRHQTKQKQIIVQPKNKENKHIRELQKQSENGGQPNKHSLKDVENQIKKNEQKNSSFELKNSPDHQKMNLQNSFIHNNINNQNTHKILFSAPQSINLSNNYLLAAKNPSQVFL
ncbi:hypothetical protein TTHERM_001176648 (macronuclear) [Tetrahymena thermophila SB210]|uniref:EGF-like domain-containing protein n=1 Tax=Tetrahymena thermophila (strain SB210) TaxID=312017 RepID=W7XHK1_TETTS|nr:hypothetical protein TTHERM_001176648 [Tetrahymena thermophila SB210]EWS72589.1 hypothetical protein TTHERM_001176648 [Tetrahymena thermophila SB210]|eukprot:XP_012654872.1 hypothetical protein TTHERM_001176648 [Tetrahymena thermophila SB210]